MSKILAIETRDAGYCMQPRGRNRLQAVDDATTYGLHAAVDLPAGLRERDQRTGMEQREVVDRPALGIQEEGHLLRRKRWTSKKEHERRIFLKSERF